jgi:hypothetical protein
VTGTTQIFFLLFFLLFTLVFVNMLIAVAVRTLSDMSSSQLEDFQVTVRTLLKGQANKTDVYNCVARPEKNLLKANCNKTPIFVLILS